MQVCPFFHNGPQQKWSNLENLPAISINAEGVLPRENDEATATLRGWDWSAPRLHDAIAPFLTNRSLYRRMCADAGKLSGRGIIALQKRFTRSDNSIFPDDVPKPKRDFAFLLDALDRAFSAL
jgi:hypothetical protein